MKKLYEDGGKRLLRFASEGVVDDEMKDGAACNRPEGSASLLSCYSLMM